MSEEPSLNQEESANSQEFNNSIFIGTKPFLNYINAAVLLFSVKGAKEIIIKARGQCISRAVDLSETLKRRFDDVFEHDVHISSSMVENKKGKEAMVSSIEITLRKG